MNRLHDKILRAMLGVSEPEAIMSDEVKSRIEQMETRMTSFYGRFMEIPADLLASIVNDLPDEKVFSVPAPPKPTPEEYIAKMSRGSLEAQLEDRGYETTDKQPIDELRKMLLKSVNDGEASKRKPEKEKEAV